MCDVHYVDWFIGVDNQFDGDAGLLHFACVLQNMEAVQVLVQHGISNKLKDRSGNCYDFVVCLFSFLECKTQHDKSKPSTEANSNLLHIYFY